jgi:hypothetical protein
MEINTVVISLSRLKELELAEKKVNEPRSKTVMIGYSHYRGYSQHYQNTERSYIVETDDECVEKLSKDLVSSISRESKLRDDLKKCEDNINSLSLMGILKFLKWKRLANKIKERDV